MDVTVAFWHLANFAVVPILLGALSAAGAKLLWRQELRHVTWLKLGLAASLAALVASVCALVVFKREGTMASYGAMVLFSTFTLWWRGLAPRRN
jgi:hypothetical protein